jgi:cytoskeletal protein RodZ
VDERETLGSYLKNQRESKKISLREVAKNTRVREHILRAIEEDQHNLLPPSTYIKGFLFAYAKYLRIDPSEVLLRYERDLRGEAVSPPRTEPRRTKQKILPTQSPKPRQKILWNMKQTWVVVGVIVASLTVFYFFSPYSSKRPVEPVPEIPVVEEKLPLPPSPPAPAITSVPEKRPFSLQLRAVEETWVSLQVDDQSEKEMTFKPGEGLSVQASNRVRMVLGNAGGMDFTFNGKPLERFGKPGEVLTLVFTSQGVEVKRPEKPKLP